MPKDENNEIIPGRREFRTYIIVIGLVILFFIIPVLFNNYYLDRYWYILIPGCLVIGLLIYRYNKFKKVFQILAEEIGLTIESSRLSGFDYYDSQVELNGKYRGFTIWIDSFLMYRQYVPITRMRIISSDSITKQISIKERDSLGLIGEINQIIEFDNAYEIKTESPQFYKKILSHKHIEKGIENLIAHRRWQQIVITDDTLSYKESGLPPNAAYLKAVLDFLIDFLLLVLREQEKGV